MMSFIRRDGPYLYKPEGHFADAFVKLARLKAKNELCDIVIKIQGREFRAHKLVLISSCPYFEAMFLSGMVESRQQEVNLQGIIEPAAFEVVLDFLYTGRICITSENVQSILSAASILQLEHLKNACSNYLHKQLAPSNCLGIKAFAEVHGCPKLVEQAKKHAVSRFSEVAASEEFLTLGIDQVVELISRDDLRVRSEEEVFDAAIGWINHDAPKRSEHIATVLKQVRLPLLSPAVLVDKVKNNKIIQNSLECRDLLDEALISFHLLPDRRGSIPPQKTRARRCTLDAGVIYAVGGLNSVGGTLSSVEKFDSTKGKWEPSKPMKTLRSRVGVAVVDGKLYAFGGYDGALRLCTVECFNPQLDEWSLKSPMSTRRSAMSIAVLGKEVFIMGGYDGNASLSSVEVYSAEGDCWRTSTSMHTCRSAAGAAVLGEYIYVVGGHDGLSIFNTVERYDPHKENWTMVTPMHIRRCRLGITAAAGRLFSIGGYDGQSFLNTVEAYDPSTNQWTKLPPMKYRRSRVGVVVVSSQVYAIGGYDGLSNLSCVEVFDLEQEQWNSAAPMERHQGGVGVAVLPLD